MQADRISDQGFLGVSALLFLTTAAITIALCTSMSGMGNMPMPGGWSMSMAWMRMPGQSWPEASVIFIGMWITMMVAMMLPSLVRMLLPYRRSIGQTAPNRLGRLTALAGAGYFFVWTLFGIVVFPLGVALAAVVMQLPALARNVPAGIGLVVLFAGIYQFTARKLYHLSCCRGDSVPGRGLAADSATGWRHGLRLGVHCCQCCAGLIAILLVIGVMDLLAMALVGIALSIERLVPAGERVARGIGVLLVGIGLFLIARAAGLMEYIYHL